MTKNISLVLLLVLLLTACGPFQTALKNPEVKPKYDLAMKYYNKGLESGRKSYFKKSNRLLEQILPQFQGKPQGGPLIYAYADGLYHLKDYVTAAYQFSKFTKSYPNSDRAEEAAFWGAKSSYMASPVYTLDQEETRIALGALQDYISKYPGGDHVGEANKLVAELRDKLEKKAFNIAELYYIQNDYVPAVTSMDNFINENPGSPYREKAYYYKADAEYDLAINSFLDVMEGRLKKAKKYSEDYMKYFPDGEYVDEIQKISEDLDKRLKDSSK